jgi:hypothetical protein
MNVVEAYKKTFKQLIVAISGLAGSGKHELAKNIQADFIMKIIDMRDYLNKENIETVEIRNVKVKNYFTESAFNWEEINKEIESNKQNGVVLIGDIIDTSKIISPIDFRISIKLQKDNLIKKRQEEKEDINSELEKTIINKLEIPYSMEINTKEQEHKTKFINANEFMNLTKEEYKSKIYDEAFNYLINLIKSKLDKEGKMIDLNDVDKNISIKTDNTIEEKEIENNEDTEKVETIDTDKLSDTSESNTDNETLNIEDSSSDSELEATFIPKDEE